jgi:hypothetical protein
VWVSPILNAAMINYPCHPHEPGEMGIPFPGKTTLFHLCMEQRRYAIPVTLSLRLNGARMTGVGFPNSQCSDDKLPLSSSRAWRDGEPVHGMSLRAQRGNPSTIQMSLRGTESRGNPILYPEIPTGSANPRNDNPFPVILGSVSDTGIPLPIS